MYPKDLRYTKEHEWVRAENGTATIGITAFAQSELGEIVFAELPETGTTFEQGQSICIVESTKAASDVYSPVSGTVKEVNEMLNERPERINASPYDEGWMVKLKNIKEADLEQLMNADQYQTFIAGQG